MITRTITFGQQLDSVCQRMGYTAASTLEDTRLPQYVSAITSAYRSCLELFPWEEATVTAEVTCTGGIVSWGSVEGADFVQCYDANPNDNTLTSYEIETRCRTAAGIHLDTTLTTVWARYTPRAPQFDPRSLVLTTSYAVEDVRYYSGQMYRCLVAGLGSTYTDPSKWKPLPLLWLFSDVVTLLAVADLLGNNEHERAQATDLRRQADDKLAMLSQRQG